MMGTKLQELRSGCFAKALDDEPMFVLLARDPGAPGLVRQWCDKRVAEIHQGKRPASDMAQIEDARGCADRMEAWRTENDGAWRTGLFARGEQLTDAVSAGMAAEEAKIPKAEQRTHGPDSAIDDDLGMRPEDAEDDERRQREAE